MRILIIGGTKFIGPYVVKALNEKGHEVVLFNRGKTNCFFPFHVDFVQGEREDLLSFKNQFNCLVPDVVIDMIAYSENDAIKLAETFRDLVKRIVVISSCDVYRAYDRLWKVFTNELIPMPLNEGSSLRDHLYPYRKIMASQNSDWSYYYDKILVENTIRSYSDINSTILRLPFVYGPGDFSRIYPYLKKMDDKRPILLDEYKANWRVSRGYVEDIANAIVLAALDNRPGNRIYNVADENVLSEFEWIQQIGQVAEWKNEVFKFPQDKLPSHLKEPLLSWEQDLTINTQLIRDELKYKDLYSLQDSIRVSIDWLRSNKPTKIDKHLFNYKVEDRALSRWSIDAQ